MVGLCSNGSGGRGNGNDQSDRERREREERRDEWKRRCRNLDEELKRIDQKMRCSATKGPYRCDELRDSERKMEKLKNDMREHQRKIQAIEEQIRKLR